MSKFTIVNNEFLPADEASVLITDLAVQRGYGIFDFFKTINGRPVFVEDHLDRFYNSAAEMRLPVDKTRDELKSMLFELIIKNAMPDSGIRITLTGGYSPDGYNVARPNMIIAQQPLVISREINMDGIKLITHPHQRQFSHVKTIDYLMAIWLQPTIQQNGADDVLYCHNGIVTECSRSNFFIVTQDDKVVTTRQNLLKGIIRKHVLKLCEASGLDEVRDVTIDDLRSCKEAFITSSTKNILPVTMIDGRVIGDGKAGEMTQQLAAELQLHIAANG